MNATAKITSKGQITLPAELRKALNLKPGDRVDFRKNEDGDYVVVAKTLRFEDLRGIIPYDGPALTDEDIVAIVDQARGARAAEIVGRMKDK